MILVILIDWEYSKFLIHREGDSDYKSLETTVLLYRYCLVKLPAAPQIYIQAHNILRYERANYNCEIDSVNCVINESVKHLFKVFHTIKYINTDCH